MIFCVTSIRLSITLTSISVLGGKLDISCVLSCSYLTPASVVVIRLLRWLGQHLKRKMLRKECLLVCCNDKWSMHVYPNVICYADDSALVSCDMNWMYVVRWVCLREAAYWFQSNYLFLNDSKTCCLNLFNYLVSLLSIFRLRK